MSLLSRTLFASLQGLEQLSTAAAADAVLLCTCIALLLDVLAVVVVLPQRAATIIVAHCNAATVLSTRRSPFTVIGLHQLFRRQHLPTTIVFLLRRAPRPAGALSPSPPHRSSSTMWLRRLHANSSTQRHDHGSSTMVLFLCLGSTAHASALPRAWHFSLSCLLASRTFVSNMGALARNFASIVLLLWWSFSRNFTISCATVVIRGLLRDSFPHDLAVIALQPRHATMGLFPAHRMSLVLLFLPRDSSPVSGAPWLFNDLMRFFPLLSSCFLVFHPNAFGNLVQRCLTCVTHGLIWCSRFLSHVVVSTPVLHMSALSCHGTQSGSCTKYQFVEWS